MGKLFDPDSPAMRGVSMFGTLVELNILWLVCCIPIVTIGASTTALYRMMFRLREDKPCGVKEFFKALKADFWKSTGVFLVLVVFGIGTWLYLQIANRSVGMMQAAMTVLSFVLFLVLGFLASYAFPLTAFFENSVFGTLKNALAISLRHLPWTLLVLVINLFPLAVLYFSMELFIQMLITFLFILPGLQSFWIAGIMRRIFENYIPET